jgi:hypothetical protein
MEKTAVNHVKAHKSLPVLPFPGRPRQRRRQGQHSAVRSRPGGPLSVPCLRAVAGARGRGGVPGGGRPGPGAGRHPDKSLNWSLRRYVQASSLRVWLVRRMPGTGSEPGSPAPPPSAAAVGGRLSGAAGWRPAADAGARQVASGGRGSGRRRDGLALPYRRHRNGQMEHFTQVATGLQGDVRRGAALAARERGGAGDLVLTTFRNQATMESSIFKFVTT